jgi:hypothetical protein
MAARHYSGLSDNQAAPSLGAILRRYEASAWRRECLEMDCPSRLGNGPYADAWRYLKAGHAIPADRTIRRALATSCADLANAGEYSPNQQKGF